MKNLGAALHPESLAGASQDQELQTEPAKETKMTKIANLAAAVALVVPVAVAILMQAAQIVV
ncbi:MAG: hypothetical protein K2P58_08055 [Hyphomonadaceae bacterium]|nr:hypothetical protein [Hyphomonadaceae bacterium]